VILCFVSLMELFFRLLGSYVYLVSLLAAGLLGYVVDGAVLPPTLIEPFALATGYLLPALLSWLVLKALRAKARLAVPVPGRYFLVLGLLASFAVHVISHSSTLQAIPWLLMSMRWLWHISVALLVVGLAIAIRSLKHSSLAPRARGSSAP